ncbi:MAG: Hpt domain-containing protein, partial [Armatimonadota bacterium]
MSEFLSVFLVEAGEQIDRLEEGFLRLEEEPDNAELLQSIFRAAHTLKGSAGMMGYSAMASLTHHLEDVLGQLRDGKLAVSPKVVDVLLLALDQLKALRNAAADGVEPDEGPVAVVVDALRTVASSSDTASDASKPLETSASTTSVQPSPVSSTRALNVRVMLADECVMPSARAFMVLRELDALGRVVESTPSRRDIEGGKAGRELRFVVETQCTADEVRGAVE